LTKYFYAGDTELGNFMLSNYHVSLTEAGKGLQILLDSLTSTTQTKLDIRFNLRFTSFLIKRQVLFSFL
jgi:hypothetical protein